jgi:hypothetical protein
MSQNTPTFDEIEIFAHEVVINNTSLADAFRATFPSSKGNGKTIQQGASDFNKIPAVVSRINELRLSQRREAQLKYGATAAWKIGMLVEAAKAGLERRVDKEGNHVPISIGGTVSAVAELNRMTGDSAALKCELTGKGGGDLVVTFPDGSFLQNVKPKS